MTGKTEDGGPRRRGFSVRIALLCLALFLAGVGTGMAVLYFRPDGNIFRSSGSEADSDDKEDERMAAELLLKKARRTASRLEEDVLSALSDLDAQLQRRSDLIPNLVATMQGYASHEETFFTNIANARGKLAGAVTIQEKAEADADLSIALSSLLVLAEAYPELKANEVFLRLQDELAGAENRIRIARVKYNEAVKAYNRNLFGMSKETRNRLGFKERDYFEPPQGVVELPLPEVNSGLR